MQEARRKPEVLCTRYFDFSRVFFSSEGGSKSPVISETELIVVLANG